MIPPKLIALIIKELISAFKDPEDADGLHHAALDPDPALLLRGNA